MQVTDVRAVIAIGRSGQFGLRGRLPWEGNRGREYVTDVERFFELTRGHVLIMGHRTFISVPDFAFKDRDIIEFMPPTGRLTCWRDVGKIQNVARRRAGRHRETTAAPSHCRRESRARGAA
jgi:dihydrofolate reductase